ncbi:hypothetical protein V8C34DRAFT_323804 [Trichoderma compactum]
MPPAKQKVYRLSNIPATADRHNVVQLLGQALSDISYDCIRIFSLAFSLNYFDESPPKTATSTFNKVPDIIQAEPNKSQWKLEVPGLFSPLILDSHFLGFTPLNDVSGPQHLCDCIAISGLSSHPFGSWQPHGSDKSFMWIRDSLPRDLPGVRTIIYGYDTALIDSTSFQTIQDLSSTLIQQLKANGWASPGSKKLVFLAHSLGGVILKDALILMAGSGEREKYMLSLTKGAIFFGVPSHGMHVSHFLAMVGNQPNQSLIRDLSNDSSYLANLDKQFDGISVIQQMKLFWAYETKTSPLYTRNPDGSVSKSGLEAVLVTPDSATRGLVSSNSSATIQIDASHSDIVKFVEHYHKYDIILSKLKEICGQRPDHIAPSYISAPNLEPPKSAAYKHANSSSLTDPYTWNYKSLVSRLQAPERDSRLGQIEETFGHTFGWAFDDRSVGLSKWLQDGEGIFWISGKPGSGKSTLMKYIVNNPKTGELLSRWKSKATMITANFFFHHRGSTVQKSLSGLLRSILSQILEDRPELHIHLRPQRMRVMLRSQVQQDPWSIGTLKGGLRHILDQKRDELDICLFLDALDEYDGQPDVISRFIEDLAQQSHDSITRIRICFSSRPWDAFVELFREVPGFKIQEHTEDDIMRYCVGIIKTHHRHGVLSDLVPEITRRAQGVFLWVKLVLQDLARGASDGATQEQLKVTLGSFPDDLYTYYTWIVERIAPSSRWAAYCALELVSRSRQGLNMRDLLEAVSCSRSEDYEDAKNRILKFRKKTHGWDNDQLEGQIRDISGGLLDVVASTDQETARPTVQFTVQFMHQTVEEFVERPMFKQIVLADHSGETYENGHSFLAKYHLLEPHPSQAIFHARTAEQTTGRSLNRFISSIPVRYLPWLSHPLSLHDPNDTEDTDDMNDIVDIDDIDYREDIAHHSVLVFAVYNRLQLYLRDEAKSQPFLCSESTEPLLSSLVTSLVNDKENCPQHDVLPTIKAILSYGFSPQNDRHLFQCLIPVLWMFKSQKEQGQISASYFGTLTSLLLDRGLDPNQLWQRFYLQEGPMPTHWAIWAAVHSIRFCKRLRPYLYSAQHRIAMTWQFFL